MSREIRITTFTTDGLVVEFVDLEQDIRTNGLVMNHAIVIPDTQQYHDRIVEVEQVLLALLDTVVKDWESATPYTITVEDPDEPSPYDNPLERELDGV